jgi:pimeloyl-ACP methyl ester carboxylesterase
MLHRPFRSAGPLLVGWCFLTVLCAGSARAEEDEQPAPLNLPTPTLGGTQFWTDLLLFRDWRIQQNALTGHCRLLDGANVRRAWGEFEHCRATLEETKTERELPPMRGKVVILLHGLCSVRYSMSPLSAYLNEHSDYTVLNMTYASTRCTLDDHADALASVLSHLEGVEQINLVAHSLGNIVIRRYFARASDAAAGRKPDPRIARIVMLGPPNNGSNLAARLDGLRLVTMVGGDPLKDLGDKWDEVKDGLATPACEFGIIAGDLSGLKLDNPLIPGGDDLMVGVEETRLPGACDFLALPAAHLLMECDSRVLEATLRFLEHGYFHSAESRAPITARLPQSPPQP